MIAKYEIWLTDSLGNRVTMLETTRDFTYTKSTHSNGFFSLTLPGTFPREQLDTTRRVAFFRKPLPNAVPTLDFVGFVRRVRADGSDEKKRRTIQGYSPNWLLGGRIVYAAAGSPNASKSDYADDMMKDIVREQMGASAAAARALNSSYFSVQSDASAGPSITKAFAYDNVLDVLRELSEVARQAGTETFFEVRALGLNRFVFVTSAEQLGNDLRDSGAVFSDESGTLENPSLSEDWGEEANFGYGLGEGTGAARTIQTAEDTERSGATWYARREVAKDARNQATAGTLAAAQSAIVAHRPFLAFSAGIVNTAGSLYGVNWGFGDRIKCSYDGRQFDGLIRAVTVSMSDSGKETISAKIEAYQ